MASYIYAMIRFANWLCLFTNFGILFSVIVVWALQFTTIILLVKIFVNITLILTRLCCIIRLKPNITTIYTVRRIFGFNILSNRTSLKTQIIYFVKILTLRTLLIRNTIIIYSIYKHILITFFHTNHIFRVFIVI